MISCAVVGLAILFIQGLSTSLPMFRSCAERRRGAAPIYARKEPSEHTRQIIAPASLLLWRYDQVVANLDHGAWTAFRLPVLVQRVIDAITRAIGLVDADVEAGL